MRLATKRSCSGSMALSLLATMYQLGLVLPGDAGLAVVVVTARWTAEWRWPRRSAARPRSGPPQKSAVASWGIQIGAPLATLTLRNRRPSRGTCLIKLWVVLVGVASDCRDVDQADDAVVGARGRDHGAAVGVADEDGRAGARFLAPGSTGSRDVGLSWCPGRTARRSPRRPRPGTWQHHLVGVPSRRYESSGWLNTRLVAWRDMVLHLRSCGALALSPLWSPQFGLRRSATMRRMWSGSLS